LPPECREALILCDLQGMTPDEAAKLLDCTDREIVWNLDRGRKLLGGDCRIVSPGMSSRCVTTQLPGANFHDVANPRESERQ